MFGSVNVSETGFGWNARLVKYAWSRLNIAEYFSALNFFMFMIIQRN